MISATLNGLPALATIAGLNASVIQMVQEIVNCLRFLAAATNKPSKSPVDFEGFPFGVGGNRPLGQSWGTTEREN